MTVNEFDCTKKWTKDICEYVRGHDLIFRSPPFDPVQHGLALGNGNLGAVVWCESSSLHVTLSRCDLWHDAAEPYNEWRREMQKKDPFDIQTLLNGCELVIDFHLPIFDSLDILAFEAILHIENGQISVKTETPYGNINLTAWIDYHRDCFHCVVKTDEKYSSLLSVTMRRFTSEAHPLWHLVEATDRSAKIKQCLATEVVYDGEMPLLRANATDGAFLCGFAADVPVSYRKENDLSFSAQFQGGGFHVAASVGAPGRSDMAAFLQTCIAHSCEEENERQWRQFWQRSFLQLNDEYLEQLWYLAMYYANCSQRGKYPGRFINGIWTHRQSIQPWSHYFHQNQQTIYWPLAAAGHAELMRPYLDWRFATMQTGEQGTRRIFGRGGLFVSDVEDRLGRPSSVCKNNHTPAAETALLFYDYYTFTGDEDFLRNRAVIYMRAAAEFLLGCAEEGEDGFLHFHGGSAYEGWLLFDDVITEISAAGKLFGRLAEALSLLGENEEAEHWRRLCGRLPALPTTQASS